MTTMEKRTGNCKHGVFVLAEGCTQCIAESRAAGAEERQQEVERVLAESESNAYILKVRFISDTTGELSQREYTYYSVDNLIVGEIVSVPVRDTYAKASVSSVNVPYSEIQGYADKVKTISSGSVVLNNKETPQKDVYNTENKDESVITEPDSQDSFIPEPETNLIELSPSEDEAVQSLYKESLSMRSHALKFEIKDTEDMKLATNDLSLISNLKKALEGRKREFIRPLREKLDGFNADFKKLLSPIEEAERIIKGKMQVHINDQRRIRQEQEEINRKRQEAAEAEMRLNDELSEPVNLVEVAPEVPSKVTTEVGTAGMRDNWKWEVVDFSLVPDEYKVVDGSLLTAIARGHHDQKPVPGIRFYNEPIMAVRSR